MTHLVEAQHVILIAQWVMRIWQMVYAQPMPKDNNAYSFWGMIGMSR